jgi:azurin
VPMPPLTMQPLNACLVGSKKVKKEAGKMRVQVIGQGKLARVQLTLKHTGTKKKRYTTCNMLLRIRICNMQTVDLT